MTLNIIITMTLGITISLTIIMNLTMTLSIIMTIIITMTLSITMTRTITVTRTISITPTMESPPWEFCRTPPWEFCVTYLSLLRGNLASVGIKTIFNLYPAWELVTVCIRFKILEKAMIGREIWEKTLEDCESKYQEAMATAEFWEDETRKLMLENLKLKASLRLWKGTAP